MSRVALPRFFVARLPDALEVVALDAAESRHARDVLRLRDGDGVALFDGSGRVALGALVGGGAKRGDAAQSVRIASIAREPPIAPAITLVVAPPKGPRLDWLVEKCTELGVTSLRFAGFERAIARLGEGHVQKLRRRSMEACKQCERAHAMTIDAISDIDATHLRAPVIVAHPSPHAVPLAAWLRTFAGDSLTAIVGPEGGLTDGEVRTLTERGATPVSLGRHILRIETAAIAVAASIMTAR